MENKPPQKKNKWLALVTIPVQMGVTIFLFSYAGTYLDETYPNTVFYYNQVLVLVGVFVALYNVIKQVNTINKSN
jgi:uncharacterized membrane protein|nr:AtpZ/AtpI family protein [uncultured Flavobacterium sp.]